MKQFVIMKTLFLSLVLGTAFLVSSCNSEIDDPKNIGTRFLRYNIIVTDSEGNDLLDPLEEKNILSHLITGTYRERKYYIGYIEYKYPPFTHYGYPHMDYYRLEFMPSWPYDFDSEKDAFRVDLGDGREYVLQRNEQGQRILNGEIIEGAPFRFVFDEQEHANIVYKPMQIIFLTVRDAAGAVLTYKGKEYKYQELQKKGFFPIIFPAYKYPRFEDIPADERLVDEPMTITWADGRKDELILNNYKNEQGRLIRNITHNGVFLGNVLEIRI